MCGVDTPRDSGDMRRAVYVLPRTCNTVETLLSPLLCPFLFSNSCMLDRCQFNGSALGRNVCGVKLVGAEDGEWAKVFPSSFTPRVIEACFAYG